MDLNYLASRARLACIGSAVLGLIVLTYLAFPAFGQAPKQAWIEPGTTIDAELKDKLFVGKTASNADRRVLLRIPNSEMPQTATGDKLRVGAELELTTRCDVGQTAPGCDYNPSVRAQLILTNNPSDTTAPGDYSTALSGIQEESCTKAKHHCLVVFRFPVTELAGAKDIPCVANNNCLINLVAWAWDPASDNQWRDHILVGQNEGDYLQNGDIVPDLARLMVVRERNINQAADVFFRDTTHTVGNNDITIPTNGNATLIYSHRLKADDLERHEQFRVKAEMTTTVTDRARFSTKMFLAKDPSRVDGPGLDEIKPVQIGEHNGSNCTGNISPCKTHKVAVFRVAEPVEGPVYVNIYAKSGAWAGGSTVKVKSGGGSVESWRYPADLRG